MDVGAMNNKPANYDIRTFVVATSKRDKTRYPNPSNFVYDLPIQLTGVFGVAIRDYQFGAETLINENNRRISVFGDFGEGVVSETLTIANGNYNNSVTDLIGAVDAAFAEWNLHVTLDATSNRVRLAFKNNGSSTPLYIAIPWCPVLRILGFETGICIYRDTDPGVLTVGGGIARYAVSVLATQPYDTWNLSEMVVRIEELEALLSNDMVTNRCTAILFNSASGCTLKQSQDRYIPLLQKQNRLQRLHIRLLNMDGDLYDTVNNEAVFILEIYCDSNLS